MNNLGHIYITTAATSMINIMLKSVNMDTYNVGMSTLSYTFSTCFTATLTLKEL